MKRVLFKRYIRDYKIKNGQIIIDNLDLNLILD